MSDDDSYINQKLGNYIIQSKLGQGGFGTVYKGIGIILKEREVAIKILNKKHLATPEEHERFLQEAHILAQLEHPFILRLYDAGVENGIPYLVTRFAENRSLRDLLRAQPLLPLPVVRTILTQVGAALQYAHAKHIVHCDLKPDNILFNSEGKALLADFGIAVPLASDETQQGKAAGTAHYMAPEQFDNKISSKCDQYALGCIAYELLTGQPPFPEGDYIQVMWKHLNEQPVPPSTCNPAIPFHIELAILKALAKDRNDRHVDIQAFIAALTNPTFDVQAYEKLKKQWLDEGRQSYDKQEYPQALDWFERVLRLDSAEVLAHRGKADTLYALGELERANDIYRHISQLDPSYVDAYVAMGSIHLQLKQLEQALQAYQQAVQWRKDEVTLYRHIAQISSTLHREDEALKAYDQIVRLVPNDVHALLRRAEIHYTYKRYEEALADYRRVVQIDPDNLPAYTAIVILLSDFLSNYEQALEANDHVLCLTPADAHALRYKATLLYRLQRYEEALSGYQAIARNYPTDVSILTAQADILYLLNCYTEALDAYNRVLGFSQGDRHALNRKGDCLCQLKRYDEALYIYRQVTHFAPHDVNAQIGIGTVLLALDGHKHQWEEALVAFDAALHRVPDNPVALNGRAEALARLHRLHKAQTYLTNGDRLHSMNNKKALQEALDAYTEAIRLDPQLAAAHAGKGDVLKRLKFPEEAMKAYETALNFNLRTDHIYESIAELHVQDGQFNKALDAINNAIQFAPKSAQLYQKKGKILVKLDRNKEAQEAFDMYRSLEDKGPVDW